MSKKYTLTESRLREIINETVGEVLRENFMDNAMTALAYAKNTVLDYLPPMAMYNPKGAIKEFNYYIEGMKNAIQKQRPCNEKFFYDARGRMDQAKRQGYVKYYKIMKQLYDQIVEMGLNHR